MSVDKTTVVVYCLRMTQKKDDTLAGSQALAMARAVDFITEMIRDETEDKQAVVYGASSIIAKLAGELLDRMGFPHKQVADVQIRTDLDDTSSIVIEFKDPDE